MPIDFSKYGTPVETKKGNTIDFSKYGTPVENRSITQKSTEKNSFVGNLVKAPLTILARPIQAGAELLGASSDSVDRVTSKLTGGLVAPVPQDYSDVKKDVGRGAQTVAFGLGPVSGGALFGAGNSLEQGNDLFSTQTAFQTALGAGVGKVLDLVGKPLLNGAGKVIGKITPQTLKDVASKGTQAISEFASQHEILPKGISSIVNAGAEKAEVIANKPFDLVGRGVKKILPKPTNIMNRVARLNPSDAQKFQQLAGKSHGQYLQETGNFGTPEQIVKNESTKFTNSRNEVDNALAGLSGTHKSIHLDNALDDLAAREVRIGVPNEETSRLSYLYNKNKAKGLTMKEINEVKRLYEKNVKLDFVRQNLPEGVARATRIDNGLREWQFKTASDQGLKNLPELNKQTQLSKFLVDKLGKQLAGKTGNEAINLTDWIILANGDPTAIASFLTKKLFSSKGIQAGVANLLSEKPSLGAIKAVYGGKSGLPSLIPNRDYGTVIEMGAPKTSTTFEAASQKINRSSSLPEQLRLQAGKSGTIPGNTLRLPKSVREYNLGLDEVTGATRGQQQSRVGVRKPYSKRLPNKPAKLGK